MSGSGTGTPVTALPSGSGLVTGPAIEPITLAELKLHLRLDSETLAGNLTTSQSILPGSHGIHELMTLDVAPGGAGWAAGDTITGATSHETCIIVTKLTALTYYVRNRSGAFTLGEILSNGTATADQGAAHPTFSSAGYYLIGTAVDVLGKTALVNLNAGTVGASGTVDAKIQESHDNATFTDWTGGAFTQVTAANDNAVQEKAYTGAKQYIRVVAKVLVAACEFGVDIIVNAATTAEDDLLTVLITAAREHVEDITRRAILTQTWDYCLDAWPKGNEIILPRGNLQTVTSVSWKDDDGTETTLTLTTDYLVETNGEMFGRIVLPYGVSWPSGTLYPSNPIRIRFVCGWTAAASIPSKIRTAVKMIAADMYENREAQSIHTTMQPYTENPTVQRLLASARLWGEF
jgi:uncharacterized phiE125 gp8 family phage protein